MQSCAISIVCTDRSICLNEFKHISSPARGFCGAARIRLHCNRFSGSPQTIIQFMQLTILATNASTLGFDIGTIAIAPSAAAAAAAAAHGCLLWWCTDVFAVTSPLCQTGRSRDGHGTVM